MQGKRLILLISVDDTRPNFGTVWFRKAGEHLFCERRAR
jgi:hypothetical protein